MDVASPSERIYTSFLSIATRAFATISGSLIGKADSRLLLAGVDAAFVARSIRVFLFVPRNSTTWRASPSLWTVLLETK